MLGEAVERPCFLPAIEENVKSLLLCSATVREKARLPREISVAGFIPIRKEDARLL